MKFEGTRKLWNYLWLGVHVQKLKPKKPGVTHGSFKPEFLSGEAKTADMSSWLYAVHAVRPLVFFSVLFS